MKLQLTNQRFGELFVLGEDASSGKTTAHTRWRCRCDCGNIYVVRGSLLVEGKTTRCSNCRAEASVATRMKRLLSPSRDVDSSVIEIYKAVLDMYSTDPSDKLKHILQLCHEAIQ